MGYPWDSSPPLRTIASSTDAAPVEHAAAAPSAKDDELDGLVLLTLAEAHHRIRPSQYRRLQAAVDAVADGQPRYAEFGRVK